MLTRYRMEMATAAVVFLLGAIAVIGALELDYGWAEDGPQAGYFPFRIGLIVMAAAVAIAVQSWYNRVALTREVFVDRAGSGRVLRFGLSILVIASLAFLGYGYPPPASDWGLLISIGKDYLKWPWAVYAPAIVTVATVLSLNRISRWLRKTD